MNTERLTSTLIGFAIVLGTLSLAGIIGLGCLWAG